MNNRVLKIYQCRYELRCWGVGRIAKGLKKIPHFVPWRSTGFSNRFIFETILAREVPHTVFSTEMSNKCSHWPVAPFTVRHQTGLENNQFRPDNADHTETIRVFVNRQELLIISLSTERISATTNVTGRYVNTPTTRTRLHTKLVKNPCGFVQTHRKASLTKYTLSDFKYYIEIVGCTHVGISQSLWHIQPIVLHVTKRQSHSRCVWWSSIACRRPSHCISCQCHGCRQTHRSSCTIVLRLYRMQYASHLLPKRPSRIDYTARASP